MSYTMRTTRALGFLLLSSLGTAWSQSMAAAPGAQRMTEWIDFDASGLDDLVILRPEGELRLLRNPGDGPLADVTAEVGLDALGAVLSVSWADMDSDGFGDLIAVTHTGELRLLANEGGLRFVSVEAGSGLEVFTPVAWAQRHRVDDDSLPDLSVRS